VFAISINLIQNNDLISKEKGYIFVSPNSEIQNSDLVLVKGKEELNIEKFQEQDKSPIGKIMMQEIIFD
jgi:hypothetical protein